MLNLIPIAVSAATTAIFLAVLKIFFKIEIKIIQLIPYAIVVAGSAVYALLLTALGYTMDIPAVSAAVCLLTLGVCVLIAFQKKSCNGRRVMTVLRRLGLAAVITAALELSVFSYSAFAAPTGGEKILSPEEAQTYTMDAEDGILSLNPSWETSVWWNIGGEDVNNASVTLESVASQPVRVTVSAVDRNFSTGSMVLYTDEVIVNGATTAIVPLSSKGMTQLTLSFSKANDVRLTAVSLNAPKAVSPNLVRLALLTFLSWAAILIVSFGIHRIRYGSICPGVKWISILAAVLCILLLAILATAHIGDVYTRDGLFTAYDADAVGKDPYYQMFDAFQKGQLHLDLEADERLAEAGELAYDSGWRAAQGVTAEWDRAYYNGKYYSYYGTAPLWIFYYPAYILSGMIPTTAAACLFFSALCVIFGFLLVMRIARTVVKEANVLLTLLAAIALPSASGIWLLMSYGDFYCVPKLCALAFLFLLGYLTIAGYERPRWGIFLLCGFCAAVILASRPNLILPALSFAPLYLGVLSDRGLALKQKLISTSAFLIPIALAVAGLMAYNAARFGSPLEFGTKYQLTVNNTAMNNTSLGFFGMALYHYFFQLPTITADFPFLSPQLIRAGRYTRYFYITPSVGVLSLPLNWSLAAYPAIRKSSGMKPAYRAALVLCIVMTALTAWLDFSMAGLTLSYVCDIAGVVAVAAITVLLAAEKASRSNRKLHRIVYLAAVILIGLTLCGCVLILLGTEPYFIKYSMPDAYGIIQNLFRF